MERKKTEDNPMPVKSLALILCAWLLAGTLPAADNLAPSVRARLESAAKLIADKKSNDAEKSLLAIEGEVGLADAEKIDLYRKFLALYTERDAIKWNAAARKLLALAGDDIKLKTEALDHIARANSFNQRYATYYIDTGIAPALRSKEAVAQMEKDHRAALEDLVKLNPDNAGYRLSLGSQYLLDKAADKAAAAFRSGLEIKGISPRQQSECLLGLANAAQLKGDRAAAIGYCKDLVGRNLSLPQQRNMTRPTDEAKFFLAYAESDLDFLKLPVYTGAKAFPPAQQAAYREEFVPLTSVKLVLGKSVRQDDVRIKLLKTKFGRLGITFADNAPFTVNIATGTGPEAPNKPEGYALTVTKTGAAISSHDAQGTLWGIVSLIQLVDHEQAPRIRLAEIVDYPTLPVRGYLQFSWKNALEFMLFCKLNTLVSQAGPQLFYNHAGLPLTPLQREISKAQSEAFTAFGLRHYQGIMTWTMWYMLPLSSERTFDLQFEICSEIARHGGHVYYPYDDIRFPMHPADVEKFGTAAAIDAKHITRLFQAVRQQYPGFQMVFCPPFYWGPHPKNPYGEPREAYLESVGKHLDPAIDVFWTGPRVKSYQKTPADVAWITGLIKRKPMIFQNGTGQHNLLAYLTDDYGGWRIWHYPGFFENDIAGYLKNSHMPDEASAVATLADFQWNMKTYHLEDSIRRVVPLLCGKEMFDILNPAGEALWIFDKYKYGSFTPEAVKELPELEKNLAIAEAAWQKAVAYNAFSLGIFNGSLGRAIKEFAKNTVDAARKAAAAPADGKQ